MLASISIQAGRSFSPVVAFTGGLADELVAAFQGEDGKVFVQERRGSGIEHAGAIRAISSGWPG